jgi:ribosomal protein S18 acetylase RimI-like enzyme
MPQGDGATMQPYRPTATDDFTAIHALITRAFAGMHAHIDPPSSLASLTIESLQSGGEVWAIGTPAIACMILTPHPDHLYLGKLAVDPAMHGKGLARILVTHAETRARALNLPRITLQTRVELTENHAAFTRLGFTQTGATAHPGYIRPTSLTFTKEVPFA